MESGAVSAMNYALVINNFVQGVIVMAIVTAVYPSMSKNGNSRNLLQLNKVFRNSSKMIMILVIPATFGVLVFSTEIVSLIFERGLFGNTATNQTATALFYYSIGFLPIGLKQIYIRVFYSINNTIKPMVAGFITVGTNICLNLIFYFYTDMGIAGLALATSISAFIGILYLELELKRVSNIFKLKSISTAVKVILSSILMSAIGKFILSVLETKFTQLDSRLSLIFAIIVSIIFYFIALIILKTEEFNELIVLFKKYINKKKER
jgi:putative peptidoglycan lipid II flippase